MSDCGSRDTAGREYYAEDGKHPDGTATSIRSDR
jgi:hypothetical protein